MVPGKKNILSGGCHLLSSGRHLIIWRPPRNLSSGHHLLSAWQPPLNLTIWRPPDKLSGGHQIISGGRQIKEGRPLDKLSGGRQIKYFSYLAPSGFRKIQCMKAFIFSPLIMERVFFFEWIAILLKGRYSHCIAKFNHSFDIAISFL